MITLDDAVERAKLMSDSSGLLSQQSYKLLYDALDEKDRYAFNMALVDHGIIAKSANTNIEQIRNKFGKLNRQIEVSEVITYESFIREGLVKSARKIVSQFDVDESGQVSYGGVSQETSTVDTQEVERMRNVLESIGLSVSQDGKVSFYKSSLPGIYTDRLPQSMPLETAVGYYNQIASTSSSEEQRANQLLDYLSQISSTADTIESILANLKTYRFSPKSQSELVRGIAEGLSSLSGFLSNGKKEDLMKTLENLKEQVEQYSFDQGAKAESYKSIFEVLNQLQGYKNSEPELYNAVVKGLGGV